MTDAVKTAAAHELMLDEAQSSRAIAENVTALLRIRSYINKNQNVVRYL